MEIRLKQIVAYAAGVLTSALGFGTYIWATNKQHKHEVAEAYQAGANEAIDSCNRKLSRVYAEPLTNLHSYAIGLSVYNEHCDQPEPFILSSLGDKLKHSDYTIVKDMYQKVRSQERTITERIDEYCHYLNDLETADWHRSLCQVNKFMEELSQELGIDVNEEWITTYQHFMSV